ncbi:MAG: hypothetical protein KAI29_29275 [Cyclobacteriaceae bacterium]|nr:hypothetical protein [Cyclobacteriaceae bacterium]
MKNYGISINEKCPCIQQECPIRGNCVLCVQNHLTHKRHIPVCIQNMLRPAVKELADKMEFATSDARPDKTFWTNFDKENFIQESIGKHKADK